MTCKTCKHWSLKEWVNDPVDGWRFCMKAQNDYGEETPFKDSLAKAEDCEAYHANLRTHEDFGCLQYERDETVTLPRT